MTGPYGTCEYCGESIARPVTEVFWCRDGCRAAWDLAKAKVALEMAKHAPRVPKPGYPRLGTDGAKTGIGGWGGTTYSRRQK